MRIGIVNDSPPATQAIRRAITNHSNHVVAWTAHSGAEAVDRCLHDQPDAILMDLIMPGMDGVETTRKIMTTRPCAILMISGSTDDNTAKIFEALSAGALDAVSSPVLDGVGGAQGARTLIEKLDKISYIVSKSLPTTYTALHRKPQREGLVAIGASAGGPAALATVLRSLPHRFGVPVVVIQHVDPQFTAGLASWLDEHCHLPVRLAQEGDRPQAGQVLVAAREEHLVFKTPHRLGYTPMPVETSYRPSVDVFFKSVEHFWRGEVVAVLLTGMGRDGAEGMRLLHEKGHHTIAQNRQTSAVYGMPKAAAEMNAASEILALDKIGPRLTKLFPTTKQQ